MARLLLYHVLKYKTSLTTPLATVIAEVVAADADKTLLKHHHIDNLRVSSNNHNHTALIKLSIHSFFNSMRALFKLSVTSQAGC